MEALEQVPFQFICFEIVGNYGTMRQLLSASVGMVL